MPIDHNYQVLIVGAGPTGLSATAALASRGVRVLLIDKNEARSDKSKALGVQAGTLECLRAAFGETLPTQMIESGRPTREAWIHFDDADPISLDLGKIPSHHNFVLILEQSETERILEELLNKFSVHVERRTELLSAEDRGSTVVSTLKLASGEVREVTSDYIIGCDGAHSIVRHLMGLSFKGGAYSGEFVLADVTLEWPWPYGSVQLFANSKGVIASFPLRGERRYRLILIPRNTPLANRERLDLDLEEFQSILSQMNDKIQIAAATWLTCFRVHHRIVGSLSKGRFFLAGDAAHIHSPAGGQGMNIGIQDALNLSFKLARVLSGEKRSVLLDSYEAERLPVARNVLRATDFAFKVALQSERRFTKFLRRYVLPRVLGSGWIQRRVVAALSEVAVARREIGGYL